MSETPRPSEEDFRPAEKIWAQLGKVSRALDECQEEIRSRGKYMTEWIERYGQLCQVTVPDPDHEHADLHYLLHAEQIQCWKEKQREDAQAIRAWLDDTVGRASPTDLRKQHYLVCARTQLHMFRHEDESGHDKEQRDGHLMAFVEYMRLYGTEDHIDHSEVFRRHWKRQYARLRLDPEFGNRSEEAKFQQTANALGVKKSTKQLRRILADLGLYTPTRHTTDS